MLHSSRKISLGWQKISLGWQNQPIAALLLDAENVCLPPEAEAFLSASCQHPIQLKLAFANWCRLGKRDRELHNAGYQMIHVPAGKNNADLKMTVDGLMISRHNPNVREVLICSADADLTHLSNTLRSMGILVHTVKRQGSKVTLLNLAEKTTQTYSIPQGAEAEPDTNDSPLKTPENPVRVPTLSQLKSWLKILILQEYQQHPDTRLTVGYLGKIFRDRNRISVNQVLKAHTGPKTLQKFLEAHEDFELSPTPDANHLQVTLRQRSQSPEPPRAPVPATKTQILDSTSLEQAIVQLLWSLSSHESGTYIDLPLLGTSFQTEHQESIKTVLKRLNLPQSLPKFLATCRSIRLKQTNKQWQVAISYLSAA